MGPERIARAAVVIFLSGVVACSETGEGEKREQVRPTSGASPSTAGPQDDPASPSAQAPDDHLSEQRREALKKLDPALRARAIPEQQAYLLELLLRSGTSSSQVRAIRDVLAQSERASFGNPDVSEPKMTQAQCWEETGELATADDDCPAANMVRVAPGAPVCIDQFEFPNVRCEYPLVWVRSSEASRICQIQGKRLCDAHEWEGACSGKLGEPNGEYSYERLPKGAGAEYRRARRLLAEDWHNSKRERVWAYGTEKQASICGTTSAKSPSCGEASWTRCGTNNYPTGSFPKCVSPQGVYDQHGNVAEHMSLPLFPEELGGVGWTEMKGSWFISEETHPDDCRWRAKNWHTTRISDPNSHNNYHLGFRCCADAAPSL